MDDAIFTAGARKIRRPSREEAEAAVRTLIAFAGEDPEREGLRDTPKRVVKAYGELFSGYGQTDEEVLDRIFTEVAGYEELILVRDIPFYSHCEHHMVPFIGKAHIAYYPTTGVVGLSKLARIVEMYARRLQTQEAMTAQICDAIETVRKPRGVAVLIEAEHLCMSMRGIKKSSARTVTSAVRGLLRNPATRAEAMSLILDK